MPCGSHPLPSPARTWVVVRMLASGWMRSAVRVDYPAGAGADARARLHARSPRRGFLGSVDAERPQPLGSIAPPPPLGSMKEPAPARRLVVVFIVRLGSGDVRVPVTRRGRCPGQSPRGCALSSSSVPHRNPLGSTPDPSPARTCVVVFICSSCSAVGVNAASGTGPDVRAGLHRALLYGVSRRGPRRSPRRRGCVCSSSSVPPVQPLGSTPPPLAGPDLRVDVHRALLYAFSRRGRWRCPRRRGRVSWSSSPSPGQPPIGSMQGPLPARTCVVLFIPPSFQPCGSMPLPSPARMCVEVFIRPSWSRAGPGRFPLRHGRGSWSS